MRKSGHNNINQINYGHGNVQQNPPMSPDNISQPLGVAIVGKRQSQHVGAQGESFGYSAGGGSIDGMRVSREQWSSPNQIGGGGHHEQPNRTIDHQQPQGGYTTGQQASTGQANTRKLQNFRKSRYAPNNTGKTSGFAQSNTINGEAQKSYRGPAHLKNGLSIGHNSMNITNGMMGNFPNSTKN